MAPPDEKSRACVFHRIFFYFLSRVWLTELLLNFFRWLRGGGSLTKYFTNTVNDTFSESQDLMRTGCTETVSLRSSLFTYTGRGLALESLNSPQIRRRYKYKIYISVEEQTRIRRDNYDNNVKWTSVGFVNIVYLLSISLAEGNSRCLIAISHSVNFVQHN